MRFFKIYGMFFRQYLKGLMEYRVDFLIGMFAFLMSQGAGLLFLYLIFQSVPSLSGFAVEEILLMYGIGLIPKGIDHLFFDNIWLLPRAILQGQMDRYLLRPISPLYVFLIERFQPDAFGELVLGSVLTSVTIARLGLNMGIFQILGLIVVVLVGTFVFTSLKLLTASTSFWVKNSYPLMQITYNISDFTKYPLTIFPRAIRLLMTAVIPFALVSFYPALFLLGRMPFWEMFAALFLVTLLFSFFGLSVWKLGLKHYESTGS